MFAFTKDHKIIHKDIRMITRSYLKDETTDILDLNSFAGSGKSTIVAEELERSGKLYVYLANNHDIAAEQKLKQPAFNDLIQIKSREKVCSVEQYKELPKIGIQIKHFCKFCGNKQTCEYFTKIIEIWDEPQPWIGVHHHLGGLLNSYVREKKVDVVVIDEFFLNAIYKNIKISIESIYHTLEKLKEYPKTETTTFLSKILMYIKELLIKPTIKFDPKIVIELVNRFFSFSEESITNIFEFIDDYEIMLAEFYFENGFPIKNIITPLIYALYNVYGFTISNDIKLVHNYVNNMFKYVTDIYKKLPPYFDITYYDILALDIDCKVIILDATTQPSFYYEIFQRPIRTLERNIALNTIFYQLTTGKFVMSTLDSDKSLSRDRLINVTKNIAKKHSDEKVLVVCRKKYEEQLNKIAKNIAVAHYPLVGSNEYDEYNICVIFGTPEPNHDVLIRKAILLGCDKDILMQIEREGYIIQAIHRTRISLKQNVETRVYILTNVELPFNNIHKISLNNLENLLSIELRNEKIVEFEEDDIIEQIYALLEFKPHRLSDLKIKLRKYHPLFITETLKRMIKSKLIVEVKPSRSIKGRPVTFYMITEHFKPNKHLKN